jgi:hypothetical protein
VVTTRTQDVGAAHHAELCFQLRDREPNGVEPHKASDPPAGRFARMSDQCPNACFGPSVGRLFDLDDRRPKSGDNWGTEPCGDERSTGAET